MVLGLTALCRSAVSKLLSPEPLNSLFGTGRVRLQGQGRALQDEGHLVDIPHHSLDLVIMNPPFTRPTNHGRRGAGSARAFVCRL